MEVLQLKNKIFVTNTTTENTRFRPSDWVERIASCNALFNTDRRLHYQNKLMPVYKQNEKYLSIDLSLEQSHPELWDYVMGFIATNKLTTVTEI